MFDTTKFNIKRFVHFTFDKLFTSLNQEPLIYKIKLHISMKFSQSN